MNSRKIIINTIVIILFLAIATLYFTFDPSTAGFYPRCPSKVIFGFECPGCGSQRAVHNLLHFNILEALRFNALLVVLLPYMMLLIYLEYFNGKDRFSKLYNIMFGRIMILVIFALILAFCIVRNFINFF